MKKKSLALIATAVMLVAVLVVGGTLAYFTDTDKAENVFTVGNVDITLTEPGWEKTGEAEAVDAYPGEALAKDPIVTNVGANPCFVRVKVTGLDQFGSNLPITYETGYVTGKLGEGWVLHTDGYFYYTKPLIVAGTEKESWNEGLTSATTKLFEQIRMPAALTNNVSEDTEGNKTYEHPDEGIKPIVVTAEAVQAQGAMPSWSNSVNGKPAVKDMTVEQIAAWFVTCGMPASASTVTE